MLLVMGFDPLSANKIDPLNVFFLKFALKPVTGSIDKETLCVVNQSIDDRCNHYIPLKDLPPVLKIVIAGQDNRTSLVSNRNQLKQEICLFFGNRYIPSSSIYVELNIN